jgi:hypothetical protein
MLMMSVRQVNMQDEEGRLLNLDQKNILRKMTRINCGNPLRKVRNTENVGQIHIKLAR